MNLSKFFLLLIIIAYSILFSGCTRVFDWGVKTFYQGCPADNCLNVPRSYLRNSRVYDQFTTLGIFTGLWLTPDVIESYVDLFTQKYSLTDDQAQELFEKEVLEKDSRLMSFYILAYSPYQKNNPLVIPGKNEDAPWVITLKINGNTYKPHKIKVIELTSIYELIFGKYLSRYKIQYLVQFLAQDENKLPIIRPETERIVLCFSSLHNKAALTWYVDSSGNLVQKRVKGCYCPDDENYNCEICWK